MVEYTEKEYCKSCGTQVFAFSKRYSISKSDYYCAKCAARLDMEYTITHTCSLCRKKIPEAEHKMVMPSKLYGDQPLPYVQRILCMHCYQKMGFRNRDTSVMRNRLQRIRASIRRSIAKRQAERQMKDVVAL